jgi:hypothetical protein
MSEESNLVTCRCQHCDGHIEFDAGLFQTGTTTPCPHCGMDTMLFIPDALKAPEKPVEIKPEKKAKLLKQTRLSGGLEDKLESVGGIFLTLGIAGGIGAILGAIKAFNDDQEVMGVELLCVAAAFIFAGVVNTNLFDAAAEVIRLLKKLNGLQYSGNITKPQSFEEHKCSGCGNLLNSTSEHCYECGAKLEK